MLKCIVNLSLHYFSALKKDKWEGIDWFDSDLGRCGKAIYTRMKSSLLNLVSFKELKTYGIVTAVISTGLDNAEFMHLNQECINGLHHIFASDFPKLKLRMISFYGLHDSFLGREWR